jgi:hypothetical protein
LAFWTTGGSCARDLQLFQTISRRLSAIMPIS